METTPEIEKNLCEKWKISFKECKKAQTIKADGLIGILLQEIDNHPFQKNSPFYDIRRQLIIKLMKLK